MNSAKQQSRTGSDLVECGEEVPAQACVKKRGYL
jgi:hypothetical protein